MPWICDVEYSEEECVAAFSAYYQFLTEMYADNSLVLHPPVGGWPMFTSEHVQQLGKTDTVISLLRHLPYLYQDEPGARGTQAAPQTWFVDWRGAVISGYGDLDVLSEGPLHWSNLPPSVIGLTSGDGEGSQVTYVLDTNLGVVYWDECPGALQDNASKEQVLDSPYDFLEEEEDAEWRSGQGVWTVSDFFAMLKDQFMRLNFVPISPRSVVDVYLRSSVEYFDMVARLQKIYRQHGWPNLQHYRKEECLAAVKQAVIEHYPLWDTL